MGFNYPNCHQLPQRTKKIKIGFDNQNGKYLSKWSSITSKDQKTPKWDLITKMRNNYPNGNQLPQRTKKHPNWV